MEKTGDSIRELTGRQLYYSFLAGAYKLFEHQQEINRINVFPVKDGDTGTNLASTFQSIVDSPIPTSSLKRTLAAMSDAALAGARGNSGIIFAQFIYGFSNEVPAGNKLSIPLFAEAMQKASGYTYQAVSVPVEGTMITVIREWAEYLYTLKDKFDDFKMLISESYEKAKQSLAETTEKLEVLKRENVVDAGAKGFVVFLEGMIEFFTSGKLKELITRSSQEKIEEFKPSRHKQFNYRYCTEALMEPIQVTRHFIQETLNTFGDSVVVAGSDQKLRFHVHTDDPAKLIDSLTGYGHVFNIKVDDMEFQEEIALNRKSSIAVVTDSSADVPKSFLEENQVHIIPLNLHFGKNHYLDRITITPERFYNKLGNTEAHPTTSQPSKKEFLNKFSYLSTYYDSIVSLNIAHVLSGTYQNAANAAQEIQESTGRKITVVDSKSVSAGLGLLLYRTVEAMKESPGHDELVRQIQSWTPKIKIYVATSTLKYMIRGGRLSPMKGFIANLLNLKPIISFDEEGRAISFSKSFGRNQSLKKIKKMIRQHTQHYAIWNYALIYSDPGERDNALEYAAKLQPIIGKPPLYIETIAPVIGANAGPGTIGVMLMFE